MLHLCSVNQKNLVWHLTALQVGNAGFQWAFQNLVDLSYAWSLASDLPYTNATTPTGSATDVVRLLPVRPPLQSCVCLVALSRGV